MSTGYVFGSIGRTCVQALSIRTVSRKSPLVTKSSSPTDMEKATNNFMYNLPSNEIMNKKMKD